MVSSKLVRSVTRPPRAPTGHATRAQAPSESIVQEPVTMSVATNTRIGLEDDDFVFPATQPSANPLERGRSPNTCTLMR